MERSSRMYRLRLFRVERLLVDQYNAANTRIYGQSRLAFVIQRCRHGDDVESVGREYDELVARARERLVVLESRLRRVQALAEVES
jgi:regulator of sirC expression with transglutaminase-like and TPR domain